MSSGPVTNDSLEATLDSVGGSPTRPSARLEEGSRVGRYEVIAPLGAGGMGVVYAAFDPELDRRVAVKVLIGESRADNTQGRGRMLREAQAMAQLSHPNVIAVHDVGTIDDRVYIAMELVDGPTLTQWLADSPRSFASILAVFVAAGRGLAAAHAVGLVHRDFKPDNVMIGSDGRARVMDFGLARRADDASTVPSTAMTTSSPRVSALGQSLTATGALMGTPAYMAPEQMVGAIPDAKSDQFSFCVALWEAIYRARPFAGRTLPELATAVIDGQIEKPGRSDVPLRVRRALERGLSTRGADRFPTMNALIETLDRPPIWRRALPVSAGAAVLVAAAYGLGVQTGAAEPVCDDGRAAIDAVFSPERSAAVDAALRGTGLPFAEHAADTVVPQLGAHAAAWQRARAELCSADAGSAAQIDRRTRCLDQRLRELTALVDVLALGEADALEHAVAMTDALPPLEQCADVAMLDARVELPIDPQSRERADAIGRELAEIDTLLGRGRFAEARTRSEAMIEDVVALDHAPVSAQHEWRLARALAEVGDPHGAEAALERGIQHAVAGRDDRMLAELAIEILEQIRASGDGATEIRRWAAVARGAITRLADRTLPEIELDYAESYARLKAGDPKGSLASAEHGLAIAEAALAPDHTEVGRMLSARGLALHALGRAVEALPGLERALAIDRHHFGAVHPRVAVGLADRGIMLGELGRVEEAAAAFEESVAISEAIYGPDNVALASSLTNLGEVRGMQARYEDAAALNRRALAMREAAYGRDHPEVATNLTNLGSALHDAGKHDEAAVLLERAADIRSRKLGADHPLLALTRLKLAGVETARGNDAAAIAAYQSALEIWRARLGERHPNVGVVMVNLGEVRIGAGEVDAGAAQLTSGIEILAEAFGPRHRDVGQAHAQLGEALLGAGRAEQARVALERALAIIREVETTPGALGDAELVLARALLELGDVEAARASAIAARDHFAAAGDARAADLEKARDLLRANNPAKLNAGDR